MAARGGRIGELYMSERVLTTDDYLAMLRRRLKVILIPALVAPLTGLLVSYASFFPARYTSTAQVLVEGQKVPDQYVQPIITADFAQRVQALEESTQSAVVLTALMAGGPLKIGLDTVQMPGLEKTYPAIFKPADRSKTISQIRQTMQVEPMTTPMSAAAAAGAKKKPTAANEPVPGFTVSYTDTEGVRAQKVCDALAQLML
ncbi:MAG: Wzz/FepE/Etk N-terminal domain-containing protein, partial [Terriglobales bacterium]